jgi:hypothetical protein
MSQKIELFSQTNSCVDEVTQDGGRETVRNSKRREGEMEMRK